MKQYQEKYFNRRNWIMDHLERFHLSSSETLVVLMIDFLNEFNEKISPELLAKKCGLSNKEIEQVLSSLNSRGFLHLSNVGFDLHYDIDAIFEKDSRVIETSDIYELFEQEFGRTLSRNDVNTISEWLRQYQYDEIVNALREALIQNKKSISYVDKVLANAMEEK